MSKYLLIVAQRSGLGLVTRDERLNGWPKLGSGKQIANVALWVVDTFIRSRRCGLG